MRENTLKNACIYCIFSECMLNCDTWNNLYSINGACGDSNHLPRDKLSAVFHRCFCGCFQSAAAGNFHPDNCYALNIIGLNDPSELFTIIYTVQFRAADQSDLPLHKFLVQVCISKGCAVGSNQQLCPVKIRRVDRCSLPVGQVGRQSPNPSQ